MASYPGSSKMVARIADESRITESPALEACRAIAENFSLLLFGKRFSANLFRNLRPDSVP
jgi:hypothetical protein